MIRVKFPAARHKQAFASWRKAYDKHGPEKCSGLTCGPNGYTYTINL